MRILFVIGLLIFPLFAMAIIPASEREALISFYEATQGDNWINNSGWKNAAGEFSPPGTEENWFGVGLNFQRTHVRRIWLQSNRLRGTLPENFTNLSELNSLNLGDNNLGEFPEVLTRMANLATIYMRHAELEGMLTSSIGDLKSLVYLDVSDNQLKGAVPESLGQLSNLRTLALGENEFTDIPNLSSLNRLAYLYLNNNQFSGPLPSWIMDLPRLEFVTLRENAFSGDFPIEFAKVDRAIKIDLRGNQITGFPFADWGPYLEVDLRQNRLGESECAALKDATEKGAEINFFQQTSGKLYCDVMRLNKTLPWISEVSQEWSSRVVIFNPTNSTAYVDLVNPEIPQSRIHEIWPGRYLITRLPRSRGYSLQVFSDTDGLVVGHQIAGFNSPSGYSPALTTGQGIKQGSSRIFFPTLPEDLQTAFALTAPLLETNEELTLRLFGANGLLGTTQLMLEADFSKAFLIPELFPDVSIDSTVVLEARAPEGVTVYGTAFAFNDLNEPAMMPAIPAANAASDWVLPWAATNEQFISHLAVFNPGGHEARIMLTATDQHGNQQAQEHIVAAEQHRTFETGVLFPGLRGYAIRVVSKRSETDIDHPVIVNLHVGNRESRPMGSSPALALGVDVTQLSPVVALPILSLFNNTPAIVLQAPDQVEPTDVVLMAVTRFGIKVLDHLRLEGSNPFPILIKELLSEHDTFASLILAQSLSGAPITGTIFNFNEFREPSMTQGQNQTWADLSISLAFQSEAEQKVAISVENGGPFVFDGVAEIFLELEGDVLATHRLDQPLGLGERVQVDLGSVDFPDQILQKNLVVKLKPISGYLDRNDANNVVSLKSDRHFKVRPSHRFGKSNNSSLTGLIYADESVLRMQVQELVLPRDESLSFTAERLKAESLEAWSDPQHRWQSQWEPETAVVLEWDEATARLHVSNLETGAVYRVHAQILGSDGQVYDYPNVVTLSQSNYESSSFQLFGKPIAETRTFHPFESRNWVPGAYLSTPLETGSTGDETADTEPLLSMIASMQAEMSLGRNQSYVMEMPEGILNVRGKEISISPPVDETEGPFRLNFHGMGEQRTLIADLNLEPVPSRSGHLYNVRNRITFKSFDQLELRDFALWGAFPRERPVMEVSGRPVAVEGFLPMEPYTWFASGLTITQSEKIKLENLDFRFHGIALQLLTNRVSLASTDPSVFVQNLHIAYSDSGMLLRHQHQTRVGPGIQIHHVSRQGIFANDCSQISIEGAVIDGARHRGINIDQSQYIQIRDNEIYNSGQSGIHFGGDVHFAAVTGNTVRTVNRDRDNPFNDKNSQDGTILSYRPLYEGIKSVRGQWGDSDHLYLANNTISDVANGIAIVQGNASDILIENNAIEAWQRGIRLEYGKARLLVDEGITFEGFLKNLFIMPDNEIQLTDPLATDDRLRHGIFFPDADPSCEGCNIDFLESYGRDFGAPIAFYPFPIDFSSYDACGDMPREDCREWLSNAGVDNVGPVYLPPLSDEDYIHPSAVVAPLDAAAVALANELRQIILENLP